jgi:hypothetical protein
MRYKSERAELKMQIAKYRQVLQRGWDATTTKLMEDAVVELEQKLRKIDE